MPSPFSAGTNLWVYPLADKSKGYLLVRAGGTTAEWWVPSIANLNAPKLSELDAGLPIADAIKTNKIFEYQSMNDHHQSFTIDDNDDNHVEPPSEVELAIAAILGGIDSNGLMHFDSNESTNEKE